MWGLRIFLLVKQWRWELDRQAKTHQGTHGDKRTAGRSSRQVRVRKRLNCIGVEGGIVCANKTNRAGSNLPKTRQDFNSWLNAMLWPLCFVERDILCYEKKVSLLLNSNLTLPAWPNRKETTLLALWRRKKTGTWRTTPAAWTCECEPSFVTFEKKFLRVSWLPIGLYPQVKCLNWIGCHVFTVLKIKADRELTHLGVFTWLVWSKSGKLVIGYNGTS